jgi:dCTP deaminase
LPCTNSRVEWVLHEDGIHPLMCVLPDHEIMEHLRTGKLKITNFTEESLTPNGYDLRISEITIPETGDSFNVGVAKVPPKAMFFISTIEHVELPANIAGQLWLRTSWIRKGVLAGLGKVDAGFNGTLTFMAFNASNAAVEIPVGGRFVQLVFETLHSPATLTYEKRSGHYQGQKGITLNPLHKGDVGGEDAHRR